MNYGNLIILFLILIILAGLGIIDNELNKQNDLKELYNTSYVENSQSRYINDFFDREDSWRLEKEANNSLKSNQTQKVVVYEVTRFKNEPLDDIYLENAWTIYDQTYKNIERKNWFNISKAQGDGYYKSEYTKDHYINENHWYDTQTLDPNKPEFLIFRKNSSGDNILAGAMFMLNNVSKEGKQIGGPLTKWHYHVYSENKCFLNGFPDGEIKIENCPDKYVSHSSPEMIHVWFVDNPGGIFATSMGVPESIIDKGNEKMNRTEFNKKVIEDDYDEGPK